MEVNLVSEMDGEDDDFILTPPPLVRRNAYIDEEPEELPFILTTDNGCLYKQEECPICFCSLDETNTIKLFCGHVLCQEDLNTIISNGSILKCHICRTLSMQPIQC